MNSSKRTGGGYIYGNELVLFTSNHPIIDMSGSGHNINVSLGTYIDFFSHLLKLQISNNADLIYNQIVRWIKPAEVHYILSILIVIYSLISKNNFVIKVLCLMSISQHVILLIFEPEHRYAYLAWILTIIIVINFINKVLLNQKIYKKLFHFKNSSTST